MSNLILLGIDNKVTFKKDYRDFSSLPTLSELSLTCDGFSGAAGKDGVWSR